jgi:hypothetical protein
MLQVILENADLVIMGLPVLALLTAGAIALVYADDASTIYQAKAWSKYIGTDDTDPVAVTVCKIDQQHVAR